MEWTFLGHIAISGLRYYGPQAAAACAAIKDSTGAPLRLCAAAGWSTACGLGASGDVWSYAANPASYSASTCNGFDAQVNQAWATGSGASRYASQPAGKVFDLSAYVAE